MNTAKHVEKQSTKMTGVLEKLIQTKKIVLVKYISSHNI